jgi:protein disulfide-isomerase A6
MYDSGSRVVKLDASNFKQKVLDADEAWIIEFYAPWCGHCKNLEPSYEKAARLLKGALKLGAVDMDDENNKGASVFESYDIRGFPTVRYFGLNKKAAP